MKELSISFGLAALSAITFLAYKHPTAYKKISSYFQAAVTIVYLSVMSWDAALTLSLSTLRPFLIVDKTKEAETAIAGMQTPFLATIGLFLVAILYLFALDFLPYLLKEEEKK